MHFQEAIDLAQKIHRTYPSWTILAIGRFVRPDQIGPETPWKVSVIPRGSDRKRMIMSVAEFEAIVEETFGGKAVAEPTPVGMLF